MSKIDKLILTIDRENSLYELFDFFCCLYGDTYNDANRIIKEYYKRYNALIEFDLLQKQIDHNISDYINFYKDYDGYCNLWENIRNLYHKWSKYLKGTYGKTPRFLKRKEIRKTYELNWDSLFNGGIRIKGRYLVFPYIHKDRKENYKLNIGINLKLTQIKVLSLKPYKSNIILIEIVYNKVINQTLDYKKYISMDIGKKYLISLVSNDVNIKPELLNVCGYLKNLFKYRRRYDELFKKSKYPFSCDWKRLSKVFFNKLSNYVIRLCLTNNIGCIAVGYVYEWYDTRFPSIDVYYSLLIEILKSKAMDQGIKVNLVEEYYTSKTDSLIKEKISSHKTYKGEREKRGLFQSNINKLIHADINGAINILRKVIGDGFIDNLIDSGFIFNPIKKNIS